MAVPAPWTPDEISTARRMWDAGKSAALISSSCSPRTKAGAALSSPLQPTAPAPFKPRWPEPFITATGCQWPLQSGPIDPGQHMTMMVCNDPFAEGTRYRRYCPFHAEYQHVKQNGEALEYA